MWKPPNSPDPYAQLEEACASYNKTKSKTSNIFVRVLVSHQVSAVVMVRPRSRVTGIIDPAMHRDPFIGDDKQKYSDPKSSSL